MTQGSFIGFHLERWGGVRTGSSWLKKINTAAGREGLIEHAFTPGRVHRDAC